MKKFLTFLCAVTLVLGLATTNANALSINYEDGVVQTTSALSGYTTYDEDMNGMTVSVLFGNGSIRNYIWGDLGSGISGITAGWGSLGLNGDTFTASWGLDTDKRQIDSIAIDAGAGDAVFDVWKDDFGTTGSARGWAFDPTFSGGSQSNAFTDIEATYTGAVALNGHAPVGDLYRYLSIDFIGGNFRSGSTLSFRADTDSLEISGDIAPVPEPATILLMGIGLLGLVGYSRKRKKS